MRHTIELISTPSDEHEGRYRMTGCDGIPAPKGYARDWLAVAKYIFDGKTHDTFVERRRLGCVWTTEGYDFWKTEEDALTGNVVSMNDADAIAFARHIFSTLAANGEHVGPDDVPSGVNVVGIVGGLLVAGLASRVVDEIIGE